MAEFLFEPTPHTEAAAAIAGKPLMARRVFDKLLPEFKARAFTIAGVQSFDVMQEIRDRIATLPAGGDWREIKKSVVADLHPYFVDPDEDAETQAAQEKAADRRAELLIRTHGSQAYAATAYQLADSQREAFPFWQYQSMGDGQVRESHAALDGIVLPADHEFWKTHTPPWDWGCRCIFIPLPPDDVQEMKDQDADKPLEKRRVLDEDQQRMLAEQRVIYRPADLANDRGHALPYNVSSPVERGQEGAFEWHPGSMAIKPSDIKERYDSTTWDEFEKWARREKIPGSDQTVWNWLEKGRAA